MFFDTRLNNHKLPYNPFKSCVIPRPIGWISSISSQNIVNIGPYSYFNAVSDIPPVIMFASAWKEDGSKKDSLRNIEETKEFVVNIATYDLHEEVNQTSASLPYNVSEAEQFNLKMIPSNLVKVPRIKLSPISLECKFISTFVPEIDGKKVSSIVVFGHVIGINIDDNIITNGKIDTTKLKPLARLGYDEYTVVKELFKMNRV